MFPDSLIDILICLVPLILLAITFFWVFTRLDKRLKKEAIETHDLSETSEETFCWQIIGCPENKRENCPAYQNQEIPCWQHFRGPEEQVLERCLKCEVFIGAPIPA